MVDFFDRILAEDEYNRPKAGRDSQAYSYSGQLGIPATPEALEQQKFYNRNNKATSDFFRAIGGGLNDVVDANRQVNNKISEYNQQFIPQEHRTKPDSQGGVANLAIGEAGDFFNNLADGNTTTGMQKLDAGFLGADLATFGGTKLARAGAKGLYDGAEYLGKKYNQGLDSIYDTISNDIKSVGSGASDLASDLGRAVNDTLTGGFNTDFLQYAKANDAMPTRKVVDDKIKSNTMAMEVNLDNSGKNVVTGEQVAGMSVINGIEKKLSQELYNKDVEDLTKAEEEEVSAQMTKEYFEKEGKVIRKIDGSYRYIVSDKDKITSPNIADILRNGTNNPREEARLTQKFNLDGGDVSEKINNSRVNRSDLNPTLLTQGDIYQNPNIEKLYGKENADKINDFPWLVNPQTHSGRNITVGSHGTSFVGNSKIAKQTREAQQILKDLNIQDPATQEQIVNRAKLALTRFAEKSPKITKLLAKSPDDLTAMEARNLEELKANLFYREATNLVDDNYRRIAQEGAPSTDVLDNPRFSGNTLLFDGIDRLKVGQTLNDTLNKGGLSQQAYNKVINNLAHYRKADGTYPTGIQFNPEVVGHELRHVTDKMMGNHSGAGFGNLTQKTNSPSQTAYGTQYLPKDTIPSNYGNKIGEVNARVNVKNEMNLTDAELADPVLQPRDGQGVKVFNSRTAEGEPFFVDEIYQGNETRREFPSSLSPDTENTIMKDVSQEIGVNKVPDYTDDIIRGEIRDISDKKMDEMLKSVAKTMEAEKAKTTAPKTDVFDKIIAGSDELPPTKALANEVTRFDPKTGKETRIKKKEQPINSFLGSPAEDVVKYDNAGNQVVTPKVKVTDAKGNVYEQPANELNAPMIKGLDHWVAKELGDDVGSVTNNSAFADSQNLEAMAKAKKFTKAEKDAFVEQYGKTPEFEASKSETKNWTENIKTTQANDGNHNIGTGSSFDPKNVQDSVSTYDGKVDNSLVSDIKDPKHKKIIKSVKNTINYQRRAGDTSTGVDRSNIDYKMNKLVELLSSVENRTIVGVNKKRELEAKENLVNWINQNIEELQNKSMMGTDTGNLRNTPTKKSLEVLGEDKGTIKRDKNTLREEREADQGWRSVDGGGLLDEDYSETLDTVLKGMGELNEGVTPQGVMDYFKPLEAEGITQSQIRASYNKFRHEMTPYNQNVKKLNTDEYRVYNYEMATQFAQIMRENGMPKVADGIMQTLETKGI